MYGRKRSMARFDERLREPKVVGKCTYCKNEIYSGSEVRQDVEEALLHEDCWEDYADIVFTATRGIINSKGEIE